MGSRRPFLIIPHPLLQQDALISEPEASPDFAHSVPGSLSDFVVAGSEDEDAPGSGCSASEDGGPPPSTCGKRCPCSDSGQVGSRSRAAWWEQGAGSRAWGRVEDTSLP